MRLPPALAATIRTPAFMSICSENMIPTTETANPAPWRSERSALASSSWACAGPSAAASTTGTSADTSPGGGRTVAARTRENANGMTDREAKGATAIPRPTTPWPEPIPTATASGNRKRDVDSRKTRPP